MALGGAMATLWIVTHVAARPNGTWLASIALVAFVALLFAALQEMSEQFKDSPKPRIRASFRRRRR